MGEPQTEYLVLPPDWKPDVDTLRWVLQGLLKSSMITAEPMPASMERYSKEQIARATAEITKDAFVTTLERAIAQHSGSDKGDGA